MSVGPRQVIALVVVVGALLWPAIGDRVQSWVKPDEHGCAHSSDVPDPEDREALAGAVLCLLNHERATHGLPALTQDPRLSAAAQRHAEDMGRRRFYAHDNPSGLSPDQRMREAGYDGATTGENIHWGVGKNATPARITKEWMESPGHRGNILRPQFTRVGIGVAAEPPEFGAGPLVGVYVQNFGG